MSCEPERAVFPPRYTRSERRVDAVVHVLGVTLGLIGAVALIIMALRLVDYRLSLSLIVYAVGLLTMLSFSALYNMVRPGSLKRMFRRFDHAAIFLMIAATYTPFTLLIGGSWGIGMLLFVWAAAGAGAMIKLVCPQRLESLSVVLYLALGWAVVVAAEPLLAAVSLRGVILLAVGGALYSIGVVFHVWRRLPYQNAIWHMFVLAAAASHYTAVLGEIPATA